MIKDKLANIGNYLPLIEIGTIQKILDNPDLESLSDGKFDIEGDNIKFGIKLSYQTKESDEGLWESHRKYLDIHIILEGKEYVEISNRSNLKNTKAYDDEGDYELWDGVAEDVVLLEKGDFIVLYPHEAHKTSVLVNSPTEVNKLVIKQEVNER